ncbi:Glucan endo-1,3-beta-glucosidase 3 isoform A [Glycine soja]|uniref:glucan endo-1,3-beta-D-glucosidase n=1 Tax=Glycine soja TaxID=3848 RepID=A0A445H1J3_GLYSO|nr:Glucan endo-1,3-beta-glucosidase 3 isoform A [Glycine soja]
MHRFIILTILLSLALAGNAHLYHFISLFLFFHFCITKVNPFILHCLFVSDGGSIGVNYGRIANNLPSAVKVVQLLKSQGLTRVKVYDTDPAVLRALSGSGIKVTVDLPNQQLFAAAKAPSFASSWVERNVAAYYPHTQIESIAVGNEVFVDPHNTTKFLVPAMKNIQKALTKHNLDKDIKVSSPIALSALANSYPSSAGSFRPELVDPVFKPMLDFLRETGSYLMVNVYPFFAYESNADVISLDYALFRDNPGVVDPGNGLRYYNLFDAQIDAVFSALSALKYDDVKIVVTETGWPSKGDSNEVGASVENAAAYNGNLVRKILTAAGTPLRPKADLTVYLFALFNENQKPGPTSERNFGLFYPDERRVYNVPLTVEELKDYHDRPSAPVSGGGQQKETPAPVVSGGVSKSTTGNTWCVANPDADKVKLQAALDFACGEGGSDCGPIQRGATCYDPNTLVAHASFAFNSYYQKQSRKGGSCYFGGTSYVVTQEPRYGSCEFPTGY